MELTKGSETSANHNLTPGKYPKEYTQSGNKLLNIKFVIFCTLSETFLILRRFEREILPKMYIGLYVNYRYSCRGLLKLEFSRNIFFLFSNVKFCENLCRGSRVVPCGRIGMTKLLVAHMVFICVIPVVCI
jgi:hypothetical protein